MPLIPRARRWAANVIDEWARSRCDRAHYVRLDGAPADVRSLARELLSLSRQVATLARQVEDLRWVIRQQAERLERLEGRS